MYLNAEIGTLMKWYREKPPNSQWCNKLGHQSKSPPQSAKTSTSRKWKNVPSHPQILFSRISWKYRNKMWMRPVSLQRYRDPITWPGRHDHIHVSYNSMNVNAHLTVLKDCQVNFIMCVEQQSMQTRWNMVCLYLSHRQTNIILCCRRLSQDSSSLIVLLRKKLFCLFSSRVTVSQRIYKIHLCPF